MSAQVAAAVLGGIWLLLVSLAVAGLIQRIKSLETAVFRQSQGRKPGSAQALRAIAPDAGARLSITLLTDPGCGICEEVRPVFCELAKDNADPKVQFRLLTMDSSDQDGAGSVRVISDLSTHATLHPGWSPALVLVDSRPQLVAIEPAGSADAVAAVVSSARSWAGAR